MIRFKDFKKEEIEEAVKNSYTYIGTAIKLGIPKSYRSIKRWCKKLNISTTHFNLIGTHGEHENIIRYCSICNKEFSVRSTNKNQLKQIICSKKCSMVNIQKDIFSKKNKTKNIECFNCKKLLTVSLMRNNKICCEDCKLILHPSRFSKAKYENRKCILCGKYFECKSCRKLVTCSRSCFKKHQSNILTGKTGGPRVHGGRGKFSYYIKKNGEQIYCQSSYELDACKIFDFLDLDWDRNTKGFPYISLDGKSRNYYPDFYINGYDFFCQSSIEIGRMVGGWLKSSAL